MRKSRHEEYIDFSLIPFVMHWGLVRTAERAGDPANWHENLEVQYCNEGEGYVLLNGNRHEIKQGDIVVANSNSLHFTGTDKKIVFSVIIIDKNLCKDIDVDYTKLMFEAVFQNQKIVDIFNKIKSAKENHDDPCQIAELKKLAIELLIELRRNHTSYKIDSAREEQAFKSVKDAIAYIHNHYSEHITLEDIADALFMDKYNLARKFKAQTGTTIIKFANGVRCKEAKNLISDGVPVHEAARACGFNNMSFFTKTFKKHIGKTPSAYKSNNKR